MFFTGCTSLSGSYGKSYLEIKDEVKSGSNAAAGFMSDYYEENSKKKEELIDVKRAFKIKDGHSEDLQKMVSFEVKTMYGDGTFLYGYSTPLTDNDKQIVHCVATYNPDTKAFKVLYENTFLRREDDEVGEGLTREEERFFFQLCREKNNRSQERLFVYDNGKAYLCDMNKHVKFSVNVEETVETFFKGKNSEEESKKLNAVEDISVSNVLSDGGERLFVELAIETEKLKEPESTDSEDDTEEIETSLKELVMVYDFEEMQSNQMLKQVNLNDDDKLINKWKEETEKTVYDSISDIPNASEDWKTVCGGTVNKWSGAFLMNMKYKEKDGDSAAVNWMKASKVDDSKADGMPMLVWKGTPLFDNASSNDWYVCSFNPQKNAYQAFTNVQANTELSKVFIPRYGKYYEVHGQTGNFQYHYKKITRTCKYKETTTTTDKDGKEVSTVETKEYSQSIRITTDRRTTITNQGGNGYLEGYATLDSLGITGLVGEYNNEILCELPKNKDLNFYCLTENFGKKGTQLNAKKDEEVEMTVVENRLYYIVSSEDSDTPKTIVKRGKVGNDGKWTTEQKEVLNLKNTEMDIGELKVETKKEKDKDKVNEQMEAVFQSEYDTWNQVIDGQFLDEVSIRADAEMVNALKTAGVNDSVYKVEGSGYLLTRPLKGLIFCPKEGNIKAVNLDSGEWYKTWKKSNGKLISVGFSETEKANYDTNGVDLAYARVMEYTINDLYKNALQKLLNKTLAANQKAKEESKAKAEESIAQSKAASENRETVEDMHTMWENSRKTTESVNLESLANEASTAATTAGSTGESKK